MGAIAAGLDGSEEAKEALLREATLRVVNVWQYGTMAALRESLPDTDLVKVERRPVEERPAGVLVNESRDADLLVAGPRGRRGFQVAQHPVAIVRGGNGKR